jgi:hypothetical protein
MASYTIGGAGTPVTYPLDADEIANGPYTARELPFSPAGAHSPAVWDSIVAEDLATGTPTAGYLPYSNGAGTPPIWGPPVAIEQPIENFGVGLIDTDSINALSPAGAYFLGSRIYVGKNITVSSATCHFYVRAAGSSQAAIYASSGTQLGISALLPMSADGFGTHTFAAPISLTAGASYFLAFWMSSQQLGIRGFQTAFPASGTFQNRFGQNAAALPSPLGTPTAQRFSPWYLLE